MRRTNVNSSLRPGTSSGDQRRGLKDALSPPPKPFEFRKKDDPDSHLPQQTRYRAPERDSFKDILDHLSLIKPVEPPPLTFWKSLKGIDEFKSKQEAVKVLQRVNAVLKDFEMRNNADADEEVWERFGVEILNSLDEEDLSDLTKPGDDGPKSKNAKNNKKAAIYMTPEEEEEARRVAEQQSLERHKEKLRRMLEAARLEDQRQSRFNIEANVKKMETLHDERTSQLIPVSSWMKETMYGLQQDLAPFESSNAAADSSGEILREMNELEVQEHVLNQGAEEIQKMRESNVSHKIQLSKMTELFRDTFDLVEKFSPQKFGKMMELLRTAEEEQEKLDTELQSYMTKFRESERQNWMLQKQLEKKSEQVVGLKMFAATEKARFMDILKKLESEGAELHKMEAEAKAAQEAAEMAENAAEQAQSLIKSSESKMQALSLEQYEVKMKLEEAESMCKELTDRNADLEKKNEDMERELKELKKANATASIVEDDGSQAELSPSPSIARTKSFSKAASFLINRVRTPAAVELQNKLDASELERDQLEEQLKELEQTTTSQIRQLTRSGEEMKRENDLLNDQVAMLRGEYQRKSEALVEARKKIEQMDERQRHMEDESKLMRKKVTAVEREQKVLQDRLQRAQDEAEKMGRRASKYSTPSGARTPVINNGASGLLLDVPTAAALALRSEGHAENSARSAVSNEEDDFDDDDSAVSVNPSKLTELWTHVLELASETANAMHMADHKRGMHDASNASIEVPKNAKKSKIKQQQASPADADAGDVETDNEEDEDAAEEEATEPMATDEHVEQCLDAFRSNLRTAIDETFDSSNRLAAGDAAEESIVSMVMSLVETMMSLRGPADPTLGSSSSAMGAAMMTAENVSRSMNHLEEEYSKLLETHENHKRECARKHLSAIDDLTEQVEQFQTEIKGLHHKLEENQQIVAEAERKAADATARVTSLNSQVATYQLKNTNLQNEMEGVRKVAEAAMSKDTAGLVKAEIELERTKIAAAHAQERGKWDSERMDFSKRIEILERMLRESGDSEGGGGPGFDKGIRRLHNAIVDVLEPVKKAAKINRIVPLQTNMKSLNELLEFDIEYVEEMLGMIKSRMENGQSFGSIDDQKELAQLREEKEALLRRLNNPPIVPLSEIPDSARERALELFERERQLREEKARANLGKMSEELHLKELERQRRKYRARGDDEDSPFMRALRRMEERRKLAILKWEEKKKSILEERDRVFMSILRVSIALAVPQPMQAHRSYLTPSSIVPRFSAPGMSQSQFNSFQSYDSQQLNQSAYGMYPPPPLPAAPTPPTPAPAQHASFSSFASSAPGMHIVSLAPPLSQAALNATTQAILAEDMLTSLSQLQQHHQANGQVVASASHYYQFNPRPFSPSTGPAPAPGVLPGSTLAPNISIGGGFRARSATASSLFGDLGASSSSNNFEVHSFHSQPVLDDLMVGKPVSHEALEEQPARPKSRSRDASPDSRPGSRSATRPSRVPSAPMTGSVQGSSLLSAPSATPWSVTPSPGSSPRISSSPRPAGSSGSVSPIPLNLEDEKQQQPAPQAAKQQARGRTSSASASRNQSLSSSSPIFFPIDAAAPAPPVPVEKEKEKPASVLPTPTKTKTSNGNGNNSNHSPSQAHYVTRHRTAEGLGLALTSKSSAVGGLEPVVRPASRALGSSLSSSSAAFPSSSSASSHDSHSSPITVSHVNMSQALSMGDSYALGNNSSLLSSSLPSISSPIQSPGRPSSVPPSKSVSFAENIISSEDDVKTLIPDATIVATPSPSSSSPAPLIEPLPAPVAQPSSSVSTFGPSVSSIRPSTSNRGSSAQYSVSEMNLPPSAQFLQRRDRERGSVAAASRRTMTFPASPASAAPTTPSLPLIAPHLVSPQQFLISGKSQELPPVKSIQ